MSGMSGMDHVPTRTGAGGVSGFLLDHGPAILIASIILVTVALALRRPPAAVVAAAVGALMYWGMYVQSGLTVMYFTIGVGLVTWLALLAAARTRRRAPSGLDI